MVTKKITTMKIKVFNSSISIPKYETIHSAGMDIRAFIPDEDIEIKPRETKLIPTGLYFEIPMGHEVQIRPRSGLALKSGITILNSPGTIDADYRGEIKVILINLNDKVFTVEKGLRIAQMVVCPVVQAKLEEVSELNDTDRGKGGFGSTGIK